MSQWHAQHRSYVAQLLVVHWVYMLSLDRPRGKTVWRCALFLGILLGGSTLVDADIYKCPDGKGGTRFQNSPCVEREVYQCPDGKGGSILRPVPCSVPISPEEQRQQSEEKSRIPAFRATPSNTPPRGWTLLRTKDPMTDHTSCVIESSGFLGRDRGEFVFASLRIVHTTAGFIVGFYGRSRGIIGPPPTFHPDIDGLGIRIDTFPFIPVDQRSGTRLLAFLPEKSAQIIQQLSQAKTAKMRVRFWPYEETVDMEDEKMDSSGFAEGLEALKQCEASAH